MSPEVLHIRVVLEQRLGVLQSQSNVVLLVKILVEGAECLVIFGSLLCLDCWVDQPVDVGGYLVITSEVDQAIDQLCVCACMCV